MIPLRAALGRMLGGRTLIRLEFRHNHLSPEQQEVVEEFHRLGIPTRPSELL